MPPLRSLLTYGIVVLVAFLAAFGAGYVYEHDPERDLVEVTIDRSALPAGDGEFASGTILTVENGVAQITGAAGTLEVTLADLAIEELRALEDPSGVLEGAAINLGGERAATEPVISGVVVIETEAAP